MRPPQPRSLPWTPEEVLALLCQSRFSWRERTVLQALVMLAKPGGRVYVGNRRLADVSSRLGPQIAAEMDLRRRRFPVIDRAYLVRVLLNLRRRGIVDHFWPRLSAKRRTFRVLRIRVEGLIACAEWGLARRRRWNSSCDPTPPDAPLPRVTNWRAHWILRRGMTHALVPICWRNQWGPE